MKRYLFRCSCQRHTTVVSAPPSLTDTKLNLFCIVCGKSKPHRRMLPSKERCKVRGCKQPYMIEGYCTGHFIKLMNDAHKRALKSKLHFCSK